MNSPVETRIELPVPLPTERYQSGEYLAHNPTWDAEDSPWKAAQVLRMIKAHGLEPQGIVEVGCGAGGVLAALRVSFPHAKLVGYEIAPHAAKFWQKHEAAEIRFKVGDICEVDSERYDLLMMLDVIEHLSDPHDMLQKLRGKAEHYVFHIPLDLSAVSVLRESPLLQVRRQVGHIHYFTKTLALSLIEESGFQVVDWFYTHAWRTAPNRNIRTRLAALPRRLLGLVANDIGVRLLGGETLMVLARSSGR